MNSKEKNKTKIIKNSKKTRRSASEKKSSEKKIFIKELENKVLELEKSNREIKEATAQLIQSEKLSALGELSASIAHELNQPLNIIKIISQSILRDIKKNEYNLNDIISDLSESVNQVNKMALIIEHMRIYTRKSEGRNEKYDINSVIMKPMILLNQQLKNHDIKIDFNLADNLPILTGNPIKIEQVLTNLITNAKNSLDQCSKENKKIEIKTYLLSDHEEEIIIEIKDNGIGIPDTIKNNLFQPIFTTGISGKGTGFSLSLCSKIIKEHHGEIKVESEHGKGALFKIILPVTDQYE